MDSNETFYRRRLPHWEKPDAAYFITFRVAGSLPKNLSVDAETELESIAQRLKDQGRPPSEYELERTLYCERLLDDDHSDPVLARPELAALVRDVPLFHSGNKYDLLAWCIMPNHVHLLLKPLSRNAAVPAVGVPAATAGDGGVPALAEIMHSIKSYSAKEAKKRGLISDKLWQREYFDRWVRNDMELTNYIEYIRLNPVVAGLVKSPEDYPWLGPRDRPEDNFSDSDRRDGGVTPFRPSTRLIQCPAMSQSFEFTLNGERITVAGFSSNTSLLEYLRSTGHTGSKEGCNEGDCGACTVLLDGRAVNSCITLLPMVAGREVISVEGLHDHPVQNAMVEHYGSQCGYCTPGFICLMAEGHARLKPNDHSGIADQLCGNLCRCTGYRPIRDARVVALRNAAVPPASPSGLRPPGRRRSDFVSRLLSSDNAGRTFQSHATNTGGETGGRRDGDRRRDQQEGETISPTHLHRGRGRIAGDHQDANRMAHRRRGDVDGDRGSTHWRIPGDG